MRTFAAIFQLFILIYIANSQIKAQDNSKPLVVVIISQAGELSERKATHLRDELLERALELTEPYPLIYITTFDFKDVTGAWAVWPLLNKLVEKLGSSESPDPDWLFLCTDSTVVRLSHLLKFLSQQDPKEKQYFGHGLTDLSATIIHHYAFFHDTSTFTYPDFAGGVAFSWNLIKELADNLKSKKKEARDFTIDPYHELAMLLWDDGKGVALTNSPQFCTTTQDAEKCVSWYSEEVTNHHCPFPVTDHDVFFAVKTCHKFHKNRIVVVKRTWAQDARHIEYYSDAEDHYIPTVDLGIDNTERGHCAKTLAIIKRFAESETSQHMEWLVVADDDTLLSVPRLFKHLSCFDPNRPIIMGERYGYGFTVDGENGYEFPTGGPGMIFSKEAATLLAKNCDCPSIDSPDDMIIGMCAKGFDMPILHSDAFHQARPIDYAVDYLARIKPISFHRHWEIDPYEVYINWLKEKPSVPEVLSGDPKQQKEHHPHSQDEL